MRILILGGTAWLGREIARTALSRGHAVTCLARGESGDVAEGATLVVADRSEPGAYAGVATRDWDAVVDVSWQPGQVRAAVAALADRVRHWTYVSSCSAYASFAQPGQDESAPLRPPTEADVVGIELYGEAKVACEEACRSSVADRLLVARAGLIGGPGDVSCRTGAWVARAACAPRAPMLVPLAEGLDTQVIDVRDLADWIVSCAESDTVGTFDAVGPVMPFADWVDLCRVIGGHDGEVVQAPDQWLLDRGVEQFMGEGSLAMWLADPDFRGFSSRSGTAALASGLVHRPRHEMVSDLLGWEREQGLDRPRRAGLSVEREAELLSALQH